MAGCFSGEIQHTATVITGGDAREGESTYPSPDENYKSSALEVEQHIWRHALVTRSQDLLLYSPDTDIYNIGLSLLEQQLSNKTIVVQINVLHKEKKNLNLNALLQKFRDDTDLASLSTNTFGKALQTAFIGSGCDYIFFFSGFGKASVLDNIVQHAKFITGGECPGTLENTDLLTKDMGFQAFVRLIGTCYFKKHLSGFAAIGKTTPNQLYYSITGDNRLKEWWNAIRSTCSERILTEEQRPPTYTALQKHWEGACWVSQMWNNSTLEDPYSSLGNAEDGWIKEEGVYKFDWETEEVAQQITEIIQFLTKGCSCKQGCTNMRCGCMKRGSFCGPGCDCRNVAAKRVSIATANVRIRVVNSPLRTTAFTPSHLDVLNNSDQSEDMMKWKKMTQGIQKMENGMIIHWTVNKVTLSVKL